jgi:hypothetical protein
MMARSRTNDDAATTAADHSQRSPRRPTVTDGDIARRAYDRYVAGGREDGHDVEDWVEAERELRGRL